MQPSNAGSAGLSSAPLALPRTNGTFSPSKPYFVRSSRVSSLDQVDQLRVVHQVALVEEHDQFRHADLPGEQDVLPVCGIGPSTAESSRMAPSICAAPVIMFLT